MVGGGSTRPRHPVLSPRGTGDANHLNRHDAHDHVSRRRDASDAEIQSPRSSSKWGYLSKSDCLLWGRCPFFFRSWTPPKRNGNRQRNRRLPRNRRIRSRSARIPCPNWLESQRTPVRPWIQSQQSRIVLTCRCKCPLQFLRELLDCGHE